MALNDRLRAFIEKNADEFIYNPSQYIGMAKESSASNIVDYVLGFFDGQLMADALYYAIDNDIPNKERQIDELMKIIFRREHEVVDAVQRALEEKK